ncbi:riboflavin biosynthesis protein RibD domain-containing protein [Eremomyces bilateralis CBS 781.70]|uniref:2,5-diamino-6-ribosylamino-4(3H)-pyrimidinone 5'-phosphate reductase n=1 Tax=Eremomyces bilateralis CBS 781.70 TaxID=1392243 RepID=A0A6G1G7E7_9PEZI|nr:riboflavin biosynthesis protein RibD domain-containing protein [Eremomyces bilateralis CBS 781.70]KAF1813932.1 riboflavin biosynthesis protein RibD domain-containing protein [Eremomyces bilateralis CBS 781.70]
MRQLRYNVAISLDGFIAPNDGSATWIVDDPDIDFTSLYAKFDTFILGRKTYESMLSMEPNPLKKVPKENLVVVSRQLQSENHTNVTIVRDDFIGYVKGLKERLGKDIWLFGGGELAGPCFDAGVVDSMETAVMPVMLRDGVKMVAMGAHVVRLELVDVRRMERSGILMCRYKVLRG